MGIVMAVQTAARRVVKHELPRDALGRLILDSYARMSDGFEGKEINVASQFEVCEQLIGSRGHASGMAFSDPLSAWKRDVVRPDWNELVRRMRDGESAGAVIYNIDRFLRQNRQLEELLDLVEGLGCILLSPGSEYDLDNEEHRMALRMQVTFANKASADTRRRVKAKLAAMRKRGILPGGGPRGFAWPGLEPLRPGHKTRKPVTEERLAAECEALVTAFDDVLKGKALAKIAREWNEAGLLSFYGNQWDSATVRATMQRGRHAGRIEHEGEVVGHIADNEPTVDPAVFDQVQMTFAARRRGRPTTKHYLASGIIRCALCLMPMVSRPRYRGGQKSRGTIPAYRCVKNEKSGRCGGVQIDQCYVDDFLRALTVKRLSDPAVTAAVSDVAMQADINAIGIQAELATANATRKSMTLKVAMGQLPQEDYDEAVPLIAQRVQALEAQLAQLMAAAADLGAVRAKSELVVAEEWDAADVEARREMLLSATRLLRVTVIQASPIKGQRVPNEERLMVAPL